MVTILEEKLIKEEPLNYDEWGEYGKFVVFFFYVRNRFLLNAFSVDKNKKKSNINSTFFKKRNKEANGFKNAINFFNHLMQ